MKNINFYTAYLSLAIITLIIISSASFYHISREFATKKYMNDEIYLAMFLNSWELRECSESYWPNWREQEKSQQEINSCISDKKEKYLAKREYRYKFNMIKYSVLFTIVFSLLWIHTVLYFIRRGR